MKEFRDRKQQSDWIDRQKQDRMLGVQALPSIAQDGDEAEYKGGLYKQILGKWNQIITIDLSGDKPFNKAEIIDDILILTRTNPTTIPISLERYVNPDLAPYWLRATGQQYVIDAVAAIPDVDLSAYWLRATGQQYVIDAIGNIAVFNIYNDIARIRTDISDNDRMPYADVSSGGQTSHPNTTTTFANLRDKILDDIPDQVQTDWNIADATDLGYLKNKPAIVVSSVNFIMYADNTAYTAGTFVVYDNGIYIYDEAIPSGNTTTPDMDSRAHHLNFGGPDSFIGFGYTASSKTLSVTRRNGIVVPITLPFLLQSEVDTRANLRAAARYTDAEKTKLGNLANFNINDVSRVRTTIADADLIPFSDESATDDPNTVIRFDNFRERVLEDLSDAGLSEAEVQGLIDDTLAGITTAMGDLQTLYVNRVYSLVLRVPYLLNVTWEIASGTLPTNVTLNAQTGRVSGTPSAIQATSAVEFLGTSAGAGTYRISISFRVLADAEGTAPSFGAIGTQSLSVGTLYNFTIPIDTGNLDTTITASIGGRSRASTNDSPNFYNNTYSLAFGDKENDLIYLFDYASGWARAYNYVWTRVSSRDFRAQTGTDEQTSAFFAGGIEGGNLFFVYSDYAASPTTHTIYKFTRSGNSFASANTSFGLPARPQSAFVTVDRVYVITDDNVCRAFDFNLNEQPSDNPTLPVVEQWTGATALDDLIYITEYRPSPVTPRYISRAFDYSFNLVPEADISLGNNSSATAFNTDNRIYFGEYGFSPDIHHMRAYSLPSNLLPAEVRLENGIISGTPLRAGNRTLQLGAQNTIGEATVNIQLNVAA